MKFLYAIYRMIVYPFILLLTLLTCLLVIPISFISISFANMLPVVYSFIVLFIMPVRLKIYGKKNIEKNKSYVFVLNHNSALDVHVAHAALKRDLRWVMKKELTQIPVFGTACKCLKHIPIDRKNPNQAVESINIAKERIHDGVCLAFFPEGTRRDDVLLGAFKKGAFYFAMDIGVPIVPVSIIGMDKIMPKNSRLFNPGKVKVFIHSPIDSAQFDRKKISEFSDKARNIIESTLKREYDLLESK